MGSLITRDDLTEVDEEALSAELKRRARLRCQGVCDYCGKHADEPPCSQPIRHSWAIRTTTASRR